MVSLRTKLPSEPCSASNASVLATDRLCSATVYPWLAKLRARFRPQWPQPIWATFSLSLGATWRRDAIFGPGVVFSPFAQVRGDVGPFRLPGAGRSLSSQLADEAEARAAAADAEGSVGRALAAETADLAAANYLRTNARVTVGQQLMVPRERLSS